MSFLFGSSKSSTEIPDWFRGPAEYMLNQSVDQSQVGYMPYAGPEVAALDPAQIASMQNTNNAANAFGMQSAMPNIQPATDFGGGIWGYSSLPLYNQQMDWMQENRPGQLDYYNSFFIDPVTGQSGSRMADTQQRQGILNQLVPDFGGPGDHGYGGNTGGPGIAGYSGIGDMFDGGGPGASGAQYGGALGGVSNAASGIFGGLY